MLPNFYPLFVLAVALLILTPGPNVALIVANSVAHGTRYGLLTVAGTVSANAVHLGFVGFGLGEVMGAIGHVFYWLKWAGVAYLVVLGLLTWRGPVTDLGAVRAQDGQAQKGQGQRMFVRAVLVGLTNPKSLLFYAAFFPPFIAADRAIVPQVWTMCATYLAVAVLIDSLWALVAGRARGLLRAHGRLRNRVSGGLLLGAGAGLALARPQ